MTATITTKTGAIPRKCRPCQVTWKGHPKDQCWNCGKTKP